jgi:hypothetical protein
VADDPLIDEFFEDCISRVKEWFKSCATGITQTWKHDHQSATSAQLPRAKGKK